MRIQEIRDIARAKGVKAGQMRKADLIRSIQRAEGNFECFGFPTDGGCDQSACAWREDCLPAPAAHPLPKRR